MHLKGKKIFISGGAGVIGSCLVDRLLAEGAFLFVGDLKACPQRWRGKLLYRQGDLNEMQEAELLAFHPEIVFHLAATFERSEETPAFFVENFRHNIQLSHHLLRLLHRCSSLKKVVFASSYLVYDSKQYIYSSEQISVDPESVTALSEDSPIWPRNLCGAAKLLHEKELAFFSAERGVPTVSARIFRVYGKGSRDLIGRWVRAALRGEPISVYGRAGIFDYIYAEDVAEGLIRLAVSSYEGPIQLGTQNPRSVAEVVQAMVSLFPDLLVKDEERSLPIERSCANIERLHNVLDWKPSRSLEDSLLEIVAFEKAAMAISEVHSLQKGVLISSVSQKGTLIQAVRAAAQKMGTFLEIHGCDSSPQARGKYVLDRFWLVPPLEKCTPELFLEYAKEHQIGVILPTRDEELPFFARHKDLWQRHGIAVFVSSFEVVQLCLDKWAFAGFLAEKGPPGIPTALDLSSLVPAQAYVLKPRWGAGGRGVRVKCTAAEAEKFAKELESPLFQPWIEGQEWSVDLYRSSVRGVIGVVARERNQVIGGEAKVTTARSFPALEKLASRLADLLGICGHCVIQVIVDAEGGFHILECNPRFGGASSASVAAGLDSFFWFFTETLGGEAAEFAFFPDAHPLRVVRLEEQFCVRWD